MYASCIWRPVSAVVRSMWETAALLCLNDCWWLPRCACACTVTLLNGPKKDTLLIIRSAKPEESSVLPSTQEKCCAAVLPHLHDPGDTTIDQWKNIYQIVYRVMPMLDLHFCHLSWPSSNYVCTFTANTAKKSVKTILITSYFSVQVRPHCSTSVSVHLLLRDGSGFPPLPLKGLAAALPSVARKFKGCLNLTPLQLPHSYLF